MFDKMVKMRNKKAFTLVEMLVVIAVIAILVAIVVPIVGKSTTKARAATNAANLRAVEGQLSTVRVSNPDLFTDVVEEFGEYVSAIQGFNDALGKLDVTGWGGWIVSSLGLNETLTLYAYKLCHFTDEDKDGVIEITSKNGSYTLTGVPLSVGVSAGGTVGMEVPEGTPMTIWISENGIVATYETTSGAYINANFAEVAETGEFNSRPSGGDTQASLECAIKHQGPFTNLGEAGHRCEHCGETIGHTMTNAPELIQNLAERLNLKVPSGGSCTYKEQGCDYTCEHTFGDEFGSQNSYHQCQKCGLIESVSGSETEPEPTPSPTPSTNPDGGDSGTGGGTGGPGGESGGGSSGCVTPETLITLADGTQKEVQYLTGEEMLLVWNLETGTYDEAPIVFVDVENEREWVVVCLEFSDGSNVEVITEHGFFDVEVGGYVYLNAENAASYIGHHFVALGTVEYNEWQEITLENVTFERLVTTAWSPVTYGHLCYYVDGVLSMPGGISGLFNIFKVDTKIMAYDSEAMENDIEKYGALTYEDFDGLIPETAFEAFNGNYLSVAIGKGMLEWTDIEALATRYAPLM